MNSWLLILGFSILLIKALIFCTTLFPFFQFRHFIRILHHFTFLSLSLLNIGRARSIFITLFILDLLSWLAPFDRCLLHLLTKFYSIFPIFSLIHFLVAKLIILIILIKYYVVVVLCRELLLYLFLLVILWSKVILVHFHFLLKCWWSNSKLVLWKNFYLYISRLVLYIVWILSKVSIIDRFNHVLNYHNIMKVCCWVVYFIASQLVISLVSFLLTLLCLILQLFLDCLLVILYRILASFDFNVFNLLLYQLCLLHFLFDLFLLQLKLFYSLFSLRFHKTLELLGGLLFLLFSLQFLSFLLFKKFSINLFLFNQLNL